MSNVAAHAAVTGDVAVKSAPGALVAVLLTAGGGAAATLILYDAASATGTVLASLKVPQGQSAQWTPPIPYAFSLLYADIGGEGAAATVVYL